MTHKAAPRWQLIVLAVSAFAAAPFLATGAARLATPAPALLLVPLLSGLAAGSIILASRRGARPRAIGFGLIAGGGAYAVFMSWLIVQVVPQWD